MVFDPEDTPTAHGPPLFDATLRASPADFRVDEQMSVEPCGEGEHLWLRLSKTRLNTTDVTTHLQRVYSVGSADVGVAGLKDKQAVTSQWFSVRTPDSIDRLRHACVGGIGIGERSATTDTEPQLEIMEHARHGRKLRRGAHAGNAFVIVLRDLRAPGAPDASEA